jgi:hypothetical protein
VARFQAALDAKLASPARTWLDIAHRFGYYDQMHMLARLRKSRPQHTNEKDLDRNLAMREIPSEESGGVNGRSVADVPRQADLSGF